MKSFERRKFIQSCFAITALSGISKKSFAFSPVRKVNEIDSNRFKISLNAYSFNEPLRNGKTNLEAVIEFCAKTGFDAIDLTGYYFPGYPVVPSDEYIFHLKRRAHTLGLAISGTGIRNEFAEPDKIKRKEEIEFVKKWIDVAAKLGAPVIRIFTGKSQPDHYTREEVEAWIVEAIQECAAYGKEKGVIIAMQNHNDFIKTAKQTQSILKKVNSEWFGLVLDTGSFVSLPPYEEINKMTSYAVNWQIKEKLNYNGMITDMDLEKLFKIIYASTYRGYLPIETLTPGDPFNIVPPFLALVKKAMAKAALA
jgi:sugar phosphate isomerase/epimerase